MMKPFIVIVGGGLAGLTAARLLNSAGIDFQLLEARNRLGGRILSADVTGEPSADGFDLGPSWFWPDFQRELSELITELKLLTFPQDIDGATIFQRSNNNAPQRYLGMRQDPPSMRIAGGTAALTAALTTGLSRDRILLETQVNRLALEDDGILLSFVRSNGVKQTLRASCVILALPPRLIESTIAFAPELDVQTALRWHETPTWMAPHAKFLALYARPFWKEAGLSGSAQSMVGPLVEVHDATTVSGMAALFGFVGVPAEQRIAVGQKTIISASIQQLATLFGPEAAKPSATLFKDWAADPLTATIADRIATGHPIPNNRPWVDGEWDGKILLAGSETSSTEPGYLAGAVEAAHRAVETLIAKLNTSQVTRRLHDRESER